MNLSTYTNIFLATILLNGCATIEGLERDLKNMSSTLIQPSQTKPTEKDMQQDTAIPTAQEVDAAKKPYASDIVLQTQKKLLALGYDVGTVDGKFGAKTEAAIQDFQLDNDLEITGKPSTSLLRVMTSRLQ